ncbi:hypothetical protein [Leptothoe spongobia]|uniref:Uncharacterized protein n=1 Tax=Leptothoe spongobia TAU-MAC 1115 TaxID=1967444 RepID=A0A947DFG4_9CYAN|nr:hypothetical protein [Leptothoe spongobia]MBT9315795.1 hypothetical protein [Leptothoe spongobia TAU-MAC 1115]
MLNQLKALLGNGQLRQKLKAVASLEEAISLIKTVGVGQEHQAFSEGLSTLVKTGFEPLNEEDLLTIAGGWASQFPSPITEAPPCA